MLHKILKTEYIYDGDKKVVNKFTHAPNSVIAIIFCPKLCSTIISPLCSYKKWGS